MSDLQLIPGSLPSDLECYQTLYDEMFSRGHAVGPNVTGLLIQDAVPDPEDHDKGWIPTASGVPIYPYVFTWHPVFSKWVARHPKGPEDPRPEMYIGDLADLATFDGGSAGSGAAGGPMWEQWTPITGRVPVGVGLIPGSSPPATIAAPLATSDSLGNSGEYKHVLTQDEGGVGDHVHPLGNADPGTGDIGLAYEVPSVTTPSYTAFGVTGGGPIGLPVTTANLLTLPANDGSGQTDVDGHNTMQPYIGVYWIIRTEREFYVAG